MYPHNLHPDEIEEIEYAANARADYLSEAFGAEARLLAQQNADEWAMDAGYTGWQGQQKAMREMQEKQRARISIKRNFATDDVPF